MREAIARREDFDLEIVNYHKNGTPYWLGIEVRRIVHQTGNVVKFIAIVALPLNPRVPHARGRIVTNVGFWKLGVFPNR
jgi:hypothetical protein